MDENERVYFKSMFRVCILLMNAFVISGACSLLFIIIPNAAHKAATWTWVVSAVCAVIFVISLIFFIKKYKSTKAWLQIHGSTKEERLAQQAKKTAEERAQIQREMLSEICDDLKKEIGELAVKQSGAVDDAARADIQKEIDSKAAELKSYEAKLRALEGGSGNAG